MNDKIAPTARTRVARLPSRAVYDREVIYQILDEALICHVGFVSDGQPFVIPTGYARVGGNIFIHGSSASRMLRSIAAGADVCVTVTLLDGLVLARSAFHHSMNYRSVVIVGRAALIDDENEKIAALRSFTEHLIPKRWDEVRKPSELELKATTVLKLAIDEASAKVRTGDPKDDEDDYNLDVWAGVIGLELRPQPPVADSKLRSGIAVPDYVRRYKRS